MVDIVWAVGLIHRSESCYIMTVNYPLIYEGHPEWFGEWYKPLILLVLLIALFFIIPYTYIELFEPYIKQVIRKR